MEYSEEDKKLWELIKNNPKEGRRFLAQLGMKSDYKEMVVDGTLDDKITEAEYKCEGER